MIFTFPLSISLLSIFLIIKQFETEHWKKYIFYSIGFCGLISSFLLSVILVITVRMNYIDQDIVFQSLDNKHDKIILQYLDEGANGSHWREVRVGRTILGVRYSNEFNTSTLNGLWIYRDWNTSKSDTVLYDNYVYKSEHNTNNNNILMK